ncbi:hypothetical protein ACFYW8_04270 [Streptomyces sp. NPDC002742]|uniref:hypothetical protein n=1 Tax=Streptomyces sp. NPDC002742 TaxID=3364663 RepID=UPI003699CE45
MNDELPDDRTIERVRSASADPEVAVPPLERLVVAGEHDRAASASLQPGAVAPSPGLCLV